jgi:hypothetical protein
MTMKGAEVLAPVRRHDVDFVFRVGYQRCIYRLCSTDEGRSVRAITGMVLEVLRW